VSAKHTRHKTKERQRKREKPKPRNHDQQTKPTRKRWGKTLCCAASAMQVVRKRGNRNSQNYQLRDDSSTCSST